MILSCISIQTLCLTNPKSFEKQIIIIIIPRHEVEGGYRFRCRPSVRHSVRLSVPKSFPEQNSETISYFQTKLDIFIDQDLNWCLLLFIDV